MISPAIAKASKAITNALRRRGISLVEITYDGEGDSGQIEDICVLHATNQRASLDPPITIALYAHKPAIPYDSLREALDAFAWILLQEYHLGYENNDGGYGTIVIDASNNSTTIDHNERVADLVNIRTEV